MTQPTQRSTEQITMHDECELEWYYSAGQVAFERSTFGGMLERAEMFSVAQLYHAEYRPVRDDCGRIIGFERAITARPTAEIRCEAGYVPHDETLRRYAHMSAMLKRVERTSSAAARVIDVLYGEQGQCWAPTEPHGRLGALYHLTVKGQQVIKEDLRKTKEAGGEFDLTDSARMWNLARRCQAGSERAQALAYCATQAKSLELHARAVWCALRRGTQEAA